MSQRLERICDKCGMKIWWNREDKTMKNTGSWYGINNILHDKIQCKPASQSIQSPLVITPYKLKVIESGAIEPINGKIDYLMDLRHLVEQRVKGTSQENNQAAIGQLLNLLLESMK